MNGDEVMNIKKEQEIYVVADYFFDSAAVNIDAVCVDYSTAFTYMLNDINDMLKTYGCYTNKTGNLLPSSSLDKNDEYKIDDIELTISENYASLCVSNLIICDWFISKSKVL